MRRRRFSHDLQPPELFPGLADPLDILRTGLARMEVYLDRCTEIIKAYGLGLDIPAPGDSLETKVQTLIFAPDEGVPEEDSLRWLGRGILDTKALLAFLDTHPASSDQVLMNFLAAWGFDTVPEMASKNTAEKLHQLMWIFYVVLDDLGDDLLMEGEQLTGFTGESIE